MLPSPPPVGAAGAPRRPGPGLSEATRAALTTSRLDGMGAMVAKAPRIWARESPTSQLHGARNLPAGRVLHPLVGWHTASSRVQPSTMRRMRHAPHTLPPASLT